tara:strand:- start:195 stop:923 length:729 start_codon:yes stop_codon:yes gene_type:complete
MLGECCENKLEIYGSKEEIVKFINENCDNYILDYKKCCTDSLLTNDVSSLSSEECSLRFQIWGTLYNSREVIKFGLGNYFSMDVSSEKVVFKFATIAFPPRIWLTKIGLKYNLLSFKLWYSQHRHYPLATDYNLMSRLKSSGWLSFYFGEPAGMDFGVPGEYYDNHCQWCRRVVKIFRNQLNTCVYCKQFAIYTIGKYVLRYRIRKAREKIAISRIGRNLIMNLYLVKKVYIPRLTECGVEM